MKKQIFLRGFTLVLLSLIIVPQLFAQNGSFTKNAVRSPLYPGEEIRVKAKIDSMGTLYSQAFNLRKYDGVSWVTFPFQLEYLAGSVLGAPGLTITLEGNFDADSTDSGWVVADTIVTGLTSEALTKATIDFGNAKYPWYRIKFLGVALGRADQTFDLRVYAYQNDLN